MKDLFGKTVEKLIEYERILFPGSECSVELVDTYDETADFNSRSVARRIDFMAEHLHSIVQKAK